MKKLMTPTTIKVALYLILHLILYGIGCFISMDVNPLNWWFFTSIPGRLILVGFEILIIGEFLKEDF